MRNRPMLALVLAAVAALAFVVAPSMEIARIARAAPAPHPSPHAGRPLQPEGGLVEKWFSSNVTTTFSSPLTAGQVTLSTAAANAGNSTIQWLGSPYGGNKARGMQIFFAGTASDNATCTFRIWTLRQMGKGSVSQDEMIREYWGSAAVTMGGLTTSIGTVVPSTDRFADTIVWTLATDATSPTGPAKAIETAFGSAGTAAYSPANDTLAVLYIPDFGNADAVVIEADKGTCTSVNAYWQRIDN